MAETLKDRYFKYAHRCLDAASRAATVEERVQFLEMAQSWRSLAEKCDVVDGLVEQAKEMRIWPAPGSEDTELGVLMGPEVRHGEAEVYARVQA